MKYFIAQKYTIFYNPNNIYTLYKILYKNKYLGNLLTRENQEWYDSNSYIDELGELHTSYIYNISFEQEINLEDFKGETVKYFLKKSNIVELLDKL